MREINDQYPEYAEPYEPVKGGKHHKGIYGTRGPKRRNSPKRFLFFALIGLLLVSTGPGGEIGVVWGLAILGVNTTAVLAGIGIVGLILGFGAQSLIEDIITGVFIIFEGQYVNGDIIILDDFRGTVRNIGVRTTIEDAGGNLKIVNNSDIRNFQNRSRRWWFTRAETEEFVGVAARFERLPFYSVLFYERL